MTTLPMQLENIFTHQTAEVDGASIHYVIGGQGSPVVLLHGWPQTWYAWRKIMPALAEKYTVIVPDLPGLGESATRETGYGASVVAEDIFHLVHSLGYEQVLLVGHDLGASVAYAYAAQHREDVRRLVILDVPINGFGLDEFAHKKKLWHFGFFQVPGLAESLAEGRERLLLQRFLESGKNPTFLTPEDVDEYVQSYSKPGSLHAGFEYYRAYPFNEQEFQVYSQQKLHMPVLALGGEYGGGGVPFSSMAQLADHVHGGVIPQSGHFIAEEQSEELVRRLNAFFSECEEV